MIFDYYNPWKLGMLVESITVAITPIEKLDKSKQYIVTTNALLTEQHDLNKPNFEVVWTAFYQKHDKARFLIDLQITDSILLWAGEDKANQEWKWHKYGYAAGTAKDTADDEFTQRIQHEGKVLVVNSVLCGGHRWFSDGHVEEVGSNKAAWDFEDEDATYDFVNEIGNYLYEGYNAHAISDWFSDGLEYVVKNMEEIQGLDHLSQIELVRMGYRDLAESVGGGQFGRALDAIASRGMTAFRVSGMDN
jgi:hypothetical protein